MRKIVGLIAVFVSITVAAGAAEVGARNVVLVTIDGVRWQEVFRGAEEALIDPEAGGVPKDTIEALRRDFLADTPEERRSRLMPFLWSTVMTQGLAFGNRDLGSPARVLNDAWSSYPCYNEMLTGRLDPLITSNAPIPNRNVTVLEWLDSRPGLVGRVAASAAWRTFTAVLNVERSGLPLFVTRQRSASGTVSPRIAELERWMEDIPPITVDEHFDVFAYHAAVEMIDTRRPRVLLLALGEPDEWAHARRYDRYLYSIQRCDRFVQMLWEKLQSLPEYRDNTTLVITTDHGRGVKSGDWTRHNRSTPHANETWLAALGPDTPALGERRNTPPVHQAQVAATVAALVGEDFNAAAPEAAPPLADLLGGGAR